MRHGRMVRPGLGIVTRTSTLVVEVVELPGGTVVYRVKDDAGSFEREEAVRHLRAAADDLESR